MRLLILLFTFLLSTYIVQAADPGKQCILDSARCILSDFTPKAGERLCETSTGNSIVANPSLIECGALELCVGSDKINNMKCNLVPGATNDADISNDTPVEAACNSWKKNKFCVSDSGAIIGIIAGAVVLLSGVAFLVYYFAFSKAPLPGEEEAKSPEADRFMGGKKRKVFKAYKDHV